MLHCRVRAQRHDDDVVSSHLADMHANGMHVQKAGKQHVRGGGILLLTCRAEPEGAQRGPRTALCSTCRAICPRELMH